MESSGLVEKLNHLEALQKDLSQTLGDHRLLNENQDIHSNVFRKRFQDLQQRQEEFQKDLNPNSKEKMGNDEVQHHDDFMEGIHSIQQIEGKMERLKHYKTANADLDHEIKAMMKSENEILQHRLSMKGGEITRLMMEKQRWKDLNVAHLSTIKQLGETNDASQTIIASKQGEITFLKAQNKFLQESLVGKLRNIKSEMDGMRREMSLCHMEMSLVRDMFDKIRIPDDDQSGTESMVEENGPKEQDAGLLVSEVPFIFFNVNGDGEDWG